MGGHAHQEQLGDLTLAVGELVQAQQQRSQVGPAGRLQHHRGAPGLSGLGRCGQPGTADDQPVTVAGPDPGHGRAVSVGGLGHRAGRLVCQRPRLMGHLVQDDRDIHLLRRPDPLASLWSLGDHRPVIVEHEQGRRVRRPATAQTVQQVAGADAVAQVWGDRREQRHLALGEERVAGSTGQARVPPGDAAGGEDGAQLVPETARSVTAGPASAPSEITPGGLAQRYRRHPVLSQLPELVDVLLGELTRDEITVQRMIDSFGEHPGHQQGVGVHERPARGGIWHLGPHQTGDLLQQLQRIQRPRAPRSHPLDQAVCGAAVRQHDRPLSRRHGTVVQPRRDLVLSSRPAR